MNKVLIALLTGFVAGILLAPHKGSVTRKKLADGVDQFSDKLSDILEAVTPENSNIEESSSMVPSMSNSI